MFLLFLSISEGKIITISRKRQAGFEVGFWIGEKVFVRDSGGCPAECADPGEDPRRGERAGLSRIPGRHSAFGELVRELGNLATPRLRLIQHAVPPNGGGGSLRAFRRAGISELEDWRMAFCIIRIWLVWWVWLIWIGIEIVIRIGLRLGFGLGIGIRISDWDWIRIRIWIRIRDWNGIRIGTVIGLLFYEKICSRG